MTRDIDPSQYLLGELDAGQMAEAEALMSTDPGFRAEVDQLRPVVGALEQIPGEVWDPPKPPRLRHPDAAAKSPLFARLADWFRGPVGVSAPVLAGAAALVLLAGVALGAGLFGGSSGEEGPAGPALALDAVGASSGSGEARVEDGGQRLRVSVEGLAASGEDDFYEVWLLTKPDKLVSLGTFRLEDAGEGEVSVPLPVNVSTYEHIDISLEPLDGDPSHSSDSVLRGNTA